MRRNGSPSPINLLPRTGIGPLPRDRDREKAKSEARVRLRVGRRILVIGVVLLLESLTFTAADSLKRANVTRMISVLIPTSAPTR